MPFTNRRWFLAGVAGVCLAGSPRAKAAGADPIDAAPGDVVWTVDTGGPSISAPSIVDETVYVSSENVYALDAETGAARWSAEEGTRSSSAPHRGRRDALRG